MIKGPEITRRDFLKLCALETAASILEACAPSPTPTRIPAKIETSPIPDRPLPTRTPLIEQEIILNQNTPVWILSDLEEVKQEHFWIGKGAMFATYEKIIRTDKPPFYPGSLPVLFKIAYPPSGMPGSPYNMDKPTFYSFNGFETYFVYNGPLIIGAQTYDRQSDGRLLAEVADIMFSSDGNKQKIKIREIHYGRNGKPIFKSDSQIDPANGYKIRETEVIGKKSNEYYFLWPRQ